MGIMFLMLMAAGLIGLLLMAIPGLAQHGHAGLGAHGVGHDIGSIGHATHLPGSPTGHSVASGHGAAQSEAFAEAGAGIARFLPSPRMIFSLLALFGAFGVAFERGAHFSVPLAALCAAVPAILLERYVMTPWWNRLVGYQGDPCAPLEALTLREAQAVTPFRNGRGVVAVEHDGRMVQLSATLPNAQANLPVRVGDKLRIEEVDAANERVTVSLH